MMILPLKMIFCDRGTGAKFLLGSASFNENENEKQQNSPKAKEAAASADGGFSLDSFYPCLLCIYMPAIDRPLSALYIHAGD